jgi:glycosyltransferase involved in cell wall biosynthesis
MRIVILGWVEFPYGSPSASRLRILSKGWIEQGATVHLVTTAKLQPVNTGIGEDFYMEGLTYESSYEEAQLDHSSFSKLSLIRHFKSLKRSWKIVRQLIDDNKCDVLYLWAWSATGCFPVVKMAQKKGIPYFFDICEWFTPDVFKWGLVNPMFYDDLLGRYLPGKTCSGVIAITHFIAHKYQKMNIPVIVVPAINDFKKEVIGANGPDIQISDTSYNVLYAGFCKPGDGIEFLIQAIRLVKLNDIPVKLIIIGADGKSGPSIKYKNICELDDKLRDIVEFRGKVPEKEYFRTLSSATVLVLPRKNTPTNEAAFPTRLPEYLTTGRPVLTTNVKDVSMYLENDVNAKIVESDSEHSLAEGLIDLWQNPSKANEIGRAGKLRGAEVFDYRSYTKEIYKLFSRSLIDRKTKF